MGVEEISAFLYRKLISKGWAWRLLSYASEQVNEDLTWPNIQGLTHLALIGNLIEAEVRLENPRDLRL